MLVSSDGKKIYLATWDKANEPKGVVVLIHGMCEYSERYSHFCQYLNQNGYTVLGIDLRGHGKTDPKNLGKTDLDFWDKTKTDITLLIEYAIELYNLPVLLYGHGLGALLLGDLLIDNRLRGIAGVAFSGTTSLDDHKFWLGRVLSFFKTIGDGGTREGKAFLRLFRYYDSRFMEGTNGWLTRNVIESGKYNTDPMSGFVCDYNFYRSVLVGIGYAQGRIPNKHRVIDPPPVHIFSGGCDHFGRRGKGVRQLVKLYRKFGIDTALTIYDRARHSLMFELNRLEIMGGVVGFFDKTITRE